MLRVPVTGHREAASVRGRQARPLRPVTWRMEAFWCKCSERGVDADSDRVLLRLLDSFVAEERRIWVTLSSSRSAQPSYESGMARLFLACCSSAVLMVQTNIDTDSVAAATATGYHPCYCC